MKKIKITKFALLCITTILLISCSEDYINNPQNSSSQNLNTKNLEAALLSVSYTMTTSRDYDTSSSKISDLNLSGLNPSTDKQEITMALFEDGQMEIIIEEYAYPLSSPRKIHQL
jgi:hypothetical protein